MDERIKNAFFTRVKGEGFARKLGLRLIHVDAGYAVVEMRPGAQETNIFGSVHGGAVFSLMDEAFQISCNSHGTVAVALGVHVVYTNPAQAESVLRAESKEIHRSPKTATYDIRVTDEQGRLIASCQALAYRKKDPLPFLDEPSFVQRLDTLLATVEWLKIELARKGDRDRVADLEDLSSRIERVSQLMEAAGKGQDGSGGPPKPDVQIHELVAKVENRLGAAAETRVNLGREDMAEIREMIAGVERALG